MRIPLSIAAASLLCTSHVRAQQEQWDTYMASYNGKPGSVLVDMGFAATAPEKLYPFLVITGPHARECNNPQGVPNEMEIDELERILGATSGMLSGATAKRLVGTFTHNCERLNYYYVNDTMKVRTAIRRMYAGNFKDYGYTVKIKYDPEWTSYRDFLYPDSLSRAWMVTSKTIAGMLASGDDLSKPRNINYSLSFPSGEGRAAFADSARAYGYTIGPMSSRNAVGTLYELVVWRNSAVKMNDIITDEALLRKLAASCNGYYTGWAAPFK